MAESIFKNNDHDLVRIRFRTTGEENMRIYRGNSDRLKGPQGDAFQFAWKTRDVEITTEEFDRNHATGTYGENFEFGTPAGSVA